MTKCSFVVALAILAASVSLTTEASVDCGKVRRQLAPCASYLTGSAVGPSDICCKGVQYIKDNADTKAGRQATCQCLKDTASAMSNIKDSAAQRLPHKCNIPISVPISKTIDCDSIE